MRRARIWVGQGRAARAGRRAIRDRRRHTGSNYVIVTRGYNFRERQASHEGLGANNCNGLEDGRKPSIQLDEQTITIREPDTSAHLPPQYDELMSERSVLCLKSALRLERRDEQGHAEAE